MLCQIQYTRSVWVMTVQTAERRGLASFTPYLVPYQRQGVASMERIVTTGT